MQFLIGFEFEFGWEPNENSSKPKKSKYIPKMAYFDHHIFIGVKSSLKSFLGSNYKFVTAITDDPSLTFNKNFRKGHFGVEVVTKPMEEKTAIEIFRKILTWMKNTPNIMTNDTCGLHVNISCTDKSINKRLDYYSILKNTPQDEILEQFDRVDNAYCKSTNTRRFSLEVNKRKTLPRTLDYWLGKTNKKSINVTTCEYGNLNSKSQKYKDKIYFSNKKDAEEKIKKAFLDALFCLEKNISVVEKISPSRKRYFEFRMIGNKNYEFRRTEILTCIKQFKKALKKSVLPEKKKKLYYDIRL